MVVVVDRNMWVMAAARPVKALKLLSSFERHRESLSCGQTYLATRQKSRMCCV